MGERTTAAGRVVSAYEPIAGLGWTVTADVATDTAFAPSASCAAPCWPSGAVLGLLLLAGLALLARALGQRARAEQRLKEREERTRQILKDLEQAKLDADRANRAKSDFLSKVSHELRTPLNAILGFGQLLQLEELNQEQAEGVDHILRGGRHLLGLINEVLDISRIQTGSLSLSPEPVGVLEVVKDTVDLIGPLAAERQITVQTPRPATAAGSSRPTTSGSSRCC